MCGLCLSLRDGHGQAARLTTNTDAVMVSVLTAAQRDASAITRTAGPCAFRSMRRADVVTSTDPGIRLATSASLTLATAKANDVVAEQRLALAPAAPARGHAARATGRALHRKATRTGDVLDVTNVLTSLDRQTDLESTSSDLDALTGPTADACVTVFSSSADLADVPDNRQALADIGSEYGRLAHLLDAIDDRADDDAGGAFNPLTATRTSDTEALARAQLSADRIAERYRDLVLHDDRLLKALLIDGIAQAVRRRRRAGERREIAAIGAGRQTWPPHPPADWPGGTPYPPPFPPDRSWYRRILPFTGVTFCGPALCTDHWNHCSDKYKAPLADCGDCCDCCDCP